MLENVLEEGIVDPVLGPQFVSNPAECRRHRNEDEGAGDQVVDVECTGDEGTAHMGCQSRGANADKKKYGLNEPECNCLKRHHGTMQAASAAGVGDANNRAAVGLRRCPRSRIGR